MSKKSLATKSPPHAVEKAISQMGARLRTARLQRNWTIDEVAEKIGIGRKSVIAAEKGKPSTGIAIYFSLFWVYNLIHQIDNLADPAMDEEGLALSMRRERARSESSATLDNDF